MPCYTPISAWKANSVNPKTGKRPIVFGKIQQAYHDMPIQLPCGRCIGCRLERSRQWAIRCMHEAQLHKDSIFVTLTYSDEALEKAEISVLRELRHEDFQKFMKRLRKRFGSGIRYYMCGEYGEKFGRPHFHAAIFGLTFKDKKLFKNFRGNKLYTSETLTKIWGHGHASFGGVTFNSAAYIARYIVKKSLGQARPFIMSASMNLGNMSKFNQNTSRLPAALVSLSPGSISSTRTSTQRTTSISQAPACDLQSITTPSTRSLRLKRHLRHSGLVPDLRSWRRSKRIADTRHRKKQKTIPEKD